jgi:pullulanase
MACLVLIASPSLQASQPDSVTVAGSLQEELGCPGDWQPDCEATWLAFDPDDDVWQQVFSVPAGEFEYKAAIDNDWAENYGLNAQLNGSNIPLSVAEDQDVKFYYSHQTHWITDSLNSLIAVAPGSFQSELGCANDWDPACLRSWLQDPDGDGILTLTTSALPAGDYEGKVAIDESWDVNYGQGGEPGGANIGFTIPSDCRPTEFSFDSASKILTISDAPGVPQPDGVTIAGSLQSELGCSADWQPDCASTALGFDAEDRVWQGIFTLPAGNYEYKAALNESWDENYGLNAELNGSNIPLSIPADAAAKFYYSHDTNWVTDSATSIIAVAPGSFQSELGCANDWDPSCLRSWLQDPEGDGIYSFSARLPAGSYEAKVALNESWDVNYGEGGEPGGANIGFTVASACDEVFFTFDSSTNILTIGSGPGGPVGDLNQLRAHWVAEDLIAWDAASDSATFALHVDPDGLLSLDETGVIGGSSVPLTFDPAGLPADVTERFPHLAGLGALRLDPRDLESVPTWLQGQIAVSASAEDGTPIDATALQIPGVLDDLFPYSGPLGADVSRGGVSVRVWAPTARTVTLLVFDSSDPASTASPVPMIRDPETGVWSAEGDSTWDRKFYQFEVEVFAPSTGQVETNRVTDPYSLSLSANSARSQFVNLHDSDLVPELFSLLRTSARQIIPRPRILPEDSSIYETHIRDFSIADTSVLEDLRGTYRGFQYPWTTGMQHLKALSAAGVTHVHLLPAFDIATIPERRSEQQSVDQAALAELPPDSDQQQAMIEPIKDLDGFNWGYDPWHYTVPEGSYATDPDGVTRIREFRDMVAGLNLIGLRVVMDVVYNHTNAAGQSPRSVLDRIVPGYYHRLSPTGAIEMSTCCPNTASEHAMMEKLMVDSIVTWAKHYWVEGFRFDLMGHHSKATMMKIRAALDDLTVARDGVDGPGILLYGEGWNFGEVANDARFVQATQLNMAGSGIGTFSDRLRDGARGGSPFSDPREQGFVTGLCVDPRETTDGQPAQPCEALLARTDWIRIGLAGDIAAFEFEDHRGEIVRADQVDYNGQPAGYTADPQEKVTYAAAHDNETLFDAVQLKSPTALQMSDRVRAQNLGNSLVALSQGIPFFHAGQDVLRSKSMDRDSFNSGDWFNQMDWTLVTSNWGRGLPVAEKNQSNWPIMQPLLADPSLAPSMSDRQRANEHFREMLAIRMHSPLFRLRTAEQIHEAMAFHNTGADQVPGLIVMSIADESGAIDPQTQRAVVVFNARPDRVEFAVEELAGAELGLHPVLQSSGDPVVRGATFEADSGTLVVPGRTTAVFLQARPNPGGTP